MKRPVKDTRSPGARRAAASHPVRSEVVEAYLQFLRDRGIRDTKARRGVLAASLELPGHFEAEQVLYLLRERGAKIGKATVYRTLPLLVDCGILQEVRLDAKRLHYKVAFGQARRDQLICRRCGRIIEFSAPELHELGKRIGRRHRFHVTGHNFQLTGLCHACSTHCPVAT